jgi:transcriptional regulator with XRE-family HTH domain
VARRTAQSPEGESNLARRVGQLRQEKGWSYERLADEMKAAGCPTHTASMFRIEKGERRITVDELIAFSRVFAMDVADLLTPIELLRKDRARSVVAAVSDAEQRLTTSIIDACLAWREWHALAEADEELWEYASHLRDDDVWQAEKGRVLSRVAGDAGLSETSRWALERALTDLRIAIIDASDRQQNEEMLRDPEKDTAELLRLLLDGSRRYRAAYNQRKAV